MIVYDINGLPKEKALNVLKRQRESNGNPIIIDNGSYQCRAGYNTDAIPPLKCRHMLAKPKVAGNNEHLYMVGNEILDLNLGKVNTISAFEKDVLINHKAMEQVFDYIFLQLGICGESISNPLLITETLCNLSSSRATMSELLFECYNAPSLLYGVDGAFSFSKNGIMEDGLIINSHYTTTHIMPVIGGKISHKNCRRINVGGYHMTDLLLKTLLLKYPLHKAKFNIDIAEEMLHRFSECAENYHDVLSNFQIKFNDYKKQLEKENRESDFFVQSLGLSPEVLSLVYGEKIENPKAGLTSQNSRLLVYRNILDYENTEVPAKISEVVIQLPFSGVIEMVNEEEIKKRMEMRKEQGKHLKEYIKKKNEERRSQLKNELDDLKYIEKLRNEDLDSFHECLISRGYNSYEEMIKRLKYLSNKLEGPKEEREEDKYNLLSIPDNKLTPEQLRAKRIQKMHKTASIARKEKKLKQQKEKEEFEAIKSKDPQKFIINLLSKRKAILKKIESRKKAKSESMYRNSKANKIRMQLISELGGDDEEKSKKGKESSSDDSFGMSDEDWEVYRGISKDPLSDDEEDDLQQVAEIEEQLLSADTVQNHPSTLMYKIPKKEDYQITLGLDRYRVAEVLFDPSIIGIDQAGIPEAVNSVLRQFPLSEQRRLVSNVYLTGGNMMIKGMDTRIYKEIRSIADVDFPVYINKVIG